MKVKVTRKFRDKYTNELYPRGMVLEITDGRYQEIARAGNFVQRIAQSEQNGTGTSRKPDTINVLDEMNESAEAKIDTSTDDGLDVMSVRELKEYADKAYKMTFKAGTKKADIIEAIRRQEHGGK